MTLLAFWMRGLLILIFAEAFIAHVRSPKRLDSTIRSLGFGRLSFLAPVVTAADALVALSLVFLPTPGAVAALAYLAIVTVPLFAARRAGTVISDCGCGSVPKPVDTGLFVRNALLGIAALALCLLPQPSVLDAAAWIAAALVALTRLLPIAVSQLARAKLATVRLTTGPREDHEVAMSGVRSLR